MSRLTYLVIFAAGLCTGLFVARPLTVLAQTHAPGAVESNRFVLLDSAGRKRGEWFMTPSGEPLLQMFDAKGKVIWDTDPEPKMRPLAR